MARFLAKRAAWAFGAATAACLTWTPFDAEPQERDLNARNLLELRAREPRQFEAAWPLRFAVLGDTHAEHDAVVSTVSAINARDDVEFIAHLGDQTDFGLLQEYDWVHRALGGSAVPVLMTLGNHDALSSGEQIYRKMYGPLDYAFTYRGVRFVFFNSNTLEFPGRAPDRDWLESEVLDRGSAHATVLLTHHSPHTGDADESVREFYAALLNTGNVTLWVHGHEADFALTRERGVMVLQCGTFERWKEHAVVSLSEDSLSIERCQGASCYPVRLESTRSNAAAR
jgi:3',5'-cyclic-AMP phosphodiesterase